MSFGLPEIFFYSAAAPYIYFYNSPLVVVSDSGPGPRFKNYPRPSRSTAFLPFSCEADSSDLSKRV